MTRWSCLEIGSFARNNEQIMAALQHEPDFIDLRMDLNYSIDFKVAEAALEDAGVACTLHLPSNPDWKPMDLARGIVPYIDIGKDIGAELVTFHTTLSTLFYRDEDIDTFLNAVPLACDVANDSGVNLAIETLGLYFTELTLLLDQEPCINLALDIGHGQIMATRNRTLGHAQAFHKRVDLVIVHDNFGTDMVDEVMKLKKERYVSVEEMRELALRYDTHLPIGEGHIEFEPIFSELKQNGYDGKFLMMCSDPSKFVDEKQKFTDLWLKS
ncbi:MAG: sugar phosphate isomerase/epimerase family protein [Candidatus Thorarchaeota archaeon]